MLSAKVIVIDEPFFRSAEEAVCFALSFAGRSSRPAGSCILERMETRRDFSALDQAALAGMITNLVKGGGRLATAIMTASVAPRTMPCTCRRTCCSGQAKNFAWHRAIEVIADEAISQGISRARYLLCVACVRKIFGEQMSQKQIAEDLELDETTVNKNYKAVHHWLRGSNVRNGRPLNAGLETIVWRSAEEVLRTRGIVG